MNVRARLVHVWSAVVVVGALTACESDGVAGRGASLFVSDVLVEAVSVRGGDTLTAGSRDSVWVVEGQGQRVTRFARRSTHGPVPATDQPVSSALSILTTMAGGMLVYAEGPLPDGDQPPAAAIPWIVEVPLSETVTLRVRIPVAYAAGEDGWVGTGESSRDLRWVAQQAERTDTVAIHVTGTLTDRRAAGGQREYTLEGTGELVLPATAEGYRLRLRHQTRRSDASADEARRRQEELRRTLTPAPEG
ncbi:MAG: hypothetical protein HY701_03880 [Gemmatimonadetes bacterium]|nr:hypothetical protein [Gemmatimonadota bacterium]